MNLTKLAALSGVSVATVSKAFRESREISRETRERVFAVAKEHGCFEKYYRPKYEKKLIAVICPEMRGNHYTHMATYFEHEITARGATMMLSVSNFSGETQRELIDYYTHFAHADGIIVIEPAEEIKNKAGIPIVQIGREHATEAVDCVSVDIGTAMDAALRFAEKMGHQSLGFIGETYAENELNYFKEATKRRKIEICPENIIVSRHRFCDAGYYGVEELMQSPAVPSCIFAGYSHIAVGALKRLSELGVRVPADISLICMDDIETVPYPDLRLSCIKMHMDELCAVAIEFLNQKLESTFFRTRQMISITRTFENRESVAVCRATEKG